MNIPILALYVSDFSSWTEIDEAVIKKAKSKERYGKLVIAFNTNEDHCFSEDLEVSIKFKNAGFVNFIGYNNIDDLINSTKYHEIIKGLNSENELIIEKTKFHPGD